MKNDSELKIGHNPIELGSGTSCLGEGEMPY